MEIFRDSTNSWRCALPLWLVAACCFALAPRSHAQPGTLDPAFYTNASASWTVSAVRVAPDGKILLGGLFEYLNGATRPRFGRLLANGQLDTSFGASLTDGGLVYAVEVDSSTNAIIGGFFTRVNGVARTNLARVRHDGALDTGFNVAPQGSVYLIGLQPGGKIVVCGGFTNVLAGGQVLRRLSIMRLNSDGSEDGTLEGPNRGFLRVGFVPYLQAMAVQADGKVLIGGYFDSFDGVGVSNLVRLNQDLTLDKSFQPAMNAPVLNIALQPDGKVLASAGFTNRLARLNVDGSHDVTFHPDVGYTDSLAVDADGRIYVSGNFYSINGVPRIRIARLHSNGDLDTGFDPGAGVSSTVDTMAVQPDGKLVIGGTFQSYDNQMRARIARILGGPSPDVAPAILTNPASQTVNWGNFVEFSVVARGSPRLNFQWQFNGTNIAGETRGEYNFVCAPEHAGNYTVVVSNEVGVVTSEPAVLTVNVYPPGFSRHPTNQTLVEGQNLRMSCVATGAPSPSLQWQFNAADIPGARFSSYAVTNVSFAHAGEYRVVASNAVGVATSQVAVVNITPAATNVGAIDISFLPQRFPLGGYRIIAAAMQPDGKILAGADQGRLWRWLPDGRLDPSFTNTGVYDFQALALQPDGRIIIGGNPSSPGVTRLNANGSRDTNFIAFSGGVYRFKALVVQPDGKIIYAADAPSSSSGGYPIFGRILSNGAPDVNFRTLFSPPPPGGSIGATVTAHALILQPDGKIIFASSLGGVVRYLPNGARDWTFTPFNAGVPVYTLSMALQNDGKLVVGWYGNNDIVNFVRLHNGGTRDTTFTPSLGGLPGGMGGPIYALALQPDGKIVAVGSLTNRTRLMRFHTNGALDAEFAVGDVQAFAGSAGPFVRVFQAPDCKPVVVGSFSSFNNYERDGAFRVLTDPPSPPDIVRQPASLTVHRGQIARFSADVTAPPKPAYQWFLHETPIPGETQPWLTITNTRTADGGNYSVVVTNGLGSEPSLAATLTVTPAPTNAGAVDVDFMSAIPNDTVLAAVRQPDGKLLIAGNFTKVGTNDRTYLARLNADGSLDQAFNAGAITNTAIGLSGPTSPAISALALQSDGAILIGGRFDRVAGQPRVNLARLQSDGALDTSFVAPADSYSSVLAIAVQTDGKIVYSQTYYSPSLRRLRTNGTVDTTFQFVNVGPSATINALALQPDGKILLGGTFTSINGLPRTGFARLLTNGVPDQTMPDLSARVNSIALLPDSIVIGGSYLTVRGFPQPYLAALTYSGVVLSNIWRPVVNQPVQLLMKDSCDRVLAAGAFTNAGSSPVRGLLRFLPDGRTDTTFTPPIFNSSVRAIATTDDAHIIAAGDFTEVNGCYRPGVARLFEGDLTVPVFVDQPTNTATVTGLDFTLSAAVICPPGTTYQWQLNGIDIVGATNTTLTIRNPRSPQSGGYQLVASNQFGMSTSALASVTLSPAPRQPGNNDIDFYPDLTNAQRVAAMALQADGKLLAAHGPPGTLARLYRYNPDGTRDLSFTSSTAEPAGLAVASSGEILAATAVRLHSLSPDGATTNFTISFSGASLTDVALQPDGKIILAGRFTSSSPTPYGARRFYPDGAIDPTFISADFDSNISSITLQPDGKILLGGHFLNVASVRSPYIARLNPDGSRDSRFVSGFTSNASVYAVAVQADGKIVAVGSFTNYAGQYRVDLVRLHPDGTLDATFNPAVSGIATRVAVQRDGKVLLAGRFAPGALQRGVLRLLPDGMVDPEFQSRPMGIDAPFTTELILAPDGDIYIGNGFFSYDGFTRFGLARLHGNPVIIGPTYSSGSFSTSMFTDPGRTYYLESTASLNSPNWNLIQTVIGNGAVQTFSDSPPGSTRYYRIRAD